MQIENKIARWYNNRYLEKGTNSWRPFEAYSIYMQLMDIQKGHRIIDVACGTGYLLKQAELKGADTFGVDISSEAVRISRKNSPNSEIKECSGEKLPFPDDYFDRLTCIGALEHFVDIDKGLNEFYRVTKKNALICLVLPNSKYFRWLFTKHKGTDQYQIKEKHATIEEWIRILENHRFVITKTLQDTWYFRNIPLFNSLNPIKMIFKIFARLSYKFIPLEYTYQFIFIIQKK